VASPRIIDNKIMMKSTTNYPRGSFIRPPSMSSRSSPSFSRHSKSESPSSSIRRSDVDGYDYSNDEESRDEHDGAGSLSSSIYSAAAAAAEDEYNDDNRVENRWETQQGSPQSNNEHGIELVLSSTATDITSDTHRAKDMIVPPSLSSKYKHQHKQQEQLQQQQQQQQRNTSNQKSGAGSGPGDVVGTRSGRYSCRMSMIRGSSLMDDQSRVDTTGKSRVESTSLISLFQPDEESETTSQSSGSKRPTIKARLIRTKKQIVDDNPWRAAKRGDLAALKRFHSEGKTDWAEEDQYHNIPLYYACHSGAIVDIGVVHFLLWVTPIRGNDVLEKCKNNKNDAVMTILNDFPSTGFSSPTQTRNRDAMSSPTQTRNRDAVSEAIPSLTTTLPVKNTAVPNMQVPNRKVGGGVSSTRREL
jgi:hypothetical protein